MLALQCKHHVKSMQIRPIHIHFYAISTNLSIHQGVLDLKTVFNNTLIGQGPNNWEKHNKEIPL